MDQSNLLLGCWQRRIFGVLWLTYSVMYLGRVNMAVALPLIENEFGWSTAAVGMISSAFFWVYAFGQLVNGILGDRLSSRIFVSIGLVGTALMNLLFGLSSTLGAMVLVWGFNGIFQSMGWGPIIKTASRWSRPEQRSSVSAFLGTTFVLGALASWYLSGRILTVLGRWELVFWIPAGVLLVQGVIWVILVRDKPSDVGLTIPGLIQEQDEASPTLQEYLRDTVIFLKQPTFLLLAVTTVFQGMIKDGINLWTPTLLMQSQNQTIGTAVAYSLIVPFLGFLGVLAASWLNHRLDGNDRKTVILFFALGAIAAVGVIAAFTRGSVVVLSVLIGLCSFVIHGVNVLLLSSVPLQYVHFGKTSTLAGFLDFASYIGSAVMTMLTGVIVSVWGWKCLLLLWVVLFFLGGISMFANRSLGQPHDIEMGEAGSF